MRVRSALSGLLVLLAVAGVAAPTHAEVQLSGPTTRFIVGFSDADAVPSLTRLRALGARGVIPLTTIDAAIVDGPSALESLLRALPRVRYVERDHRLRFASYQSDAQTGVGTVRNGTAPLLRAYTGAGISVANVDTGVGTHPDLEGQVARHLNFDGIQVYGQLLPVAQADQLVETTPPVQGQAATHGLSVSATLLGTGAAAQGGVDFRGVATGAKVVDFGTCCVNDTSTAGSGVEGLGSVMLFAYDYMIRHRNDPQYPGGIRVATNQWGVLPTDDTPRTAIDAILAKAIDSGITVVFAAGNDGPGANTVWAPARDLPELLVAAAACPAVDGGQELLNGAPCGLGEMADYSSEGPAVDIAAPVSGIWAARYPSSAASQGEAAIPPPGASDPLATASNRVFYGKFGGTSAAAPYVSGVIALMLEANPNLTPAQIRDIVETTAHDFGPPGWDKEWGHGEVRAAAAVQAALALVALPPSPPAVAGELPATGDLAHASVGWLLVSVALCVRVLRRRIVTLVR